ncbi:hypothetical protein [Epilithonimonas zeae]|uniref:hypothetical protein n=1 Tax=Epilithonimonas zeae TaxID=1416779 RepID=UPI00200C7B8D|nr:hypothetical protein [Epilithonimonas zeae]UQB69457.1 hypothetical protein KI430_03240 [Epilithonimonas zeae]
MQKIDIEIFQAIIENTNFKTIKLTNKQVHLEDSIDIEMYDRSFYFENCIFTGGRINFRNYEEGDNHSQSIQFINCTISNDLFIKDCKLYKIEFSNVNINSNHFHISTLDVEYLSISGSPEKYNNINSLILHNLNIHTQIADLDFRLNNINSFHVNNCIFITIQINSNNIKRLHFDKLVNKNYFQFWKNNLMEYSTIKKSVLNEFIGKSSIYGQELKFEQTSFNEVCRLDKVPSKSQSSINFIECIFEKSVFFDESTFYQIATEGVFFKDIVSFNSTTVHKIKFKSVHFDKIAFFNGFKIISLKLVDIGTIRIIKNQLYKTENKVDFLKYNVLEQNILLNDKNISFNDRAILTLNKISNNFGSNWIQGILFTMLVSFLGFFLLLLINNFSQNNSYEFVISLDNNVPSASFQEILGEWLKFTFSLDVRIYKNYESNGFLLLTFFLFKIIVGYGIYQTIAAFRKHSK